jgi:hypothetical protein
VDLLDELRTLITRHAVGQRGHSKELLDGVQISRVDEPTGPSAGVAQPSVAIVASGIKQTLLNGVSYEYQAGQFLVASLDLPVIGQALKASPDEPFLVVSLRLDPVEIAPLLLETPARHRSCSIPSFGCCGSPTGPTMCACSRRGSGGRSCGGC